MTGLFGGLIIGAIVGFALLAVTNFAFALLTSLVVLMGSLFLFSAISVLFPSYFSQWCYLGFAAISGDEDSNLPWSIFVSVILASVGMLTLVFSTVFRIQLTAIIGLALIVPFAVVTLAGYRETRA